jgi:hypothetical protein
MKALEQGRADRSARKEAGDVSTKTEIFESIRKLAVAAAPGVTEAQAISDWIEQHPEDHERYRSAPLGAPVKKADPPKMPGASIAAAIDEMADAVAERDGISKYDALVAVMKTDKGALLEEGYYALTGARG